MSDMNKPSIIRSPDLDLFAARLKDVRTLRRMSLQDVADASGFTKSHVWELENGSARNPTVRAVWSLSAALCVSPAWLLGLDHEATHLDPLAHQVAALINTELARRNSAWARSQVALEPAPTIEAMAERKRG